MFYLFQPNRWQWNQRENEWKKDVQYAGLTFLHIARIKNQITLNHFDWILQQNLYFELITKCWPCVVQITCKMHANLRGKSTSWTVNFLCVFMGNWSLWDRFFSLDYNTFSFTSGKNVDNHKTKISSDFQ